MVDQYKTKENQGNLVNLAVWARDSHETVLHLILKKSHKKVLAGISRPAEMEKIEAGMDKRSIYQPQAENRIFFVFFAGIEKGSRSYLKADILSFSKC